MKHLFNTCSRLRGVNEIFLKKLGITATTRGSRVKRVQAPAGEPSSPQRPFPRKLRPPGFEFLIGAVKFTPFNVACFDH